MFAERTRLAFWITLLTLAGLYLIELTFATALGAGLPLPVRYFLVGVGLIVLAAVTLTATWRQLSSRWPHWNRLGRSLCFYASIGIVFYGAYSVAGLTRWFPYLLLFAAVLGGNTTLSYTSKTGGFYGPLLFVALLAFTSTYFVRQIYLYHENLSVLEPAFLSLVFLVLVGGVLLGYLCSSAENYIQSNPNGSYRFPALSLLTIFLIVLTGVLFHDPPQWAFTADYEGKPLKAAPTGERTPPNVILISLDTLRIDQLLSDKHAERFKQLREDGIVFQNVISTSSWTLPAHASFFTGKIPEDAGAVRSGTTLDDAVPSYTQYLQQAGYQTAAFTDGGYLHQNFGFGRGFDTYWHQSPKLYGEYVPGVLEWTAMLLEPFDRTFNHSPVPDSLRSESRNYVKKTSQQARQWIQKQPSGDPFFLFFHTYQAHDYWMRFPETIQRFRKNHPDLVPVLENRRTDSITRFNKISKPLIEAYEILYHYETERTVKRVENFLEHLREKNLYRDSLILFVSDHGEAFSFDPLVVGHNNGQIHETLIRTPVVLKLPKNEHGGKHLAQHLSLRDLFPMILDELNLTFGESVTWRKFQNLDALLDDKIEGRKLTKGSVLHKKVENGYRPKLFVRSRNYLMARNLIAKRTRFFELRDDPPFQERVRSSELPADERKILTDAMKAYRKRLREEPDPYRGFTDTAEGRRKMLRGLGYY